MEDIQDGKQLADIAPANNIGVAAEEESTDSGHNERGWYQVNKMLKFAMPKTEASRIKV